jgi:hypothetical protein
MRRLAVLAVLLALPFVAPAGPVPCEVAQSLAPLLVVGVQSPAPAEPATIDQLMRQLIDLRAQKAEIEKKEKATLAELRKRLELLRDLFKEIGLEPPPDGPKDPPVDPIKPPRPTAALYFLVVRPDGPALPDFTAYMANPGWDELRKAGHAVKDKTLGEAAALGVTVPPGTILPAVVTLRVNPDNKSSTVVVPARPLPAPGDIAKLPEGAK